MARYLSVGWLTSHPLVPHPQVALGSGSFRGHRYLKEVVLVVVEHLLKAIKVKAIADVLIVDPAEELMILEITKPADPPVAVL